MGFIIQLDFDNFYPKNNPLLIIKVLNYNLFFQVVERLSIVPYWN